MKNTPPLNWQLIKKYNQSGPRYTSYPTAVVFDEGFNQQAYIKNLKKLHITNCDQPLSLYVHIPFCDTLCFYCACQKIATKKREKADIYLDYLDKEMALYSQWINHNRVVEQMHFGGGTPTFLNTKQMNRLRSMISQYFHLSTGEHRDYSIEIDPRSVSSDDIAHLADWGFNRFSLGVQDINPLVQKAINRIQPLDMVERVFKDCRARYARSISVDLIYGLPLQTLQSFADTIDAMINLGVDRLSVFNYAHMPHMFTPQKRIQQKDLPKPDEKLALLQMCIEKLTKAGYVYIGMDHFAKPDDELAKAQINQQLQRNFQGYTTHADLDLIALGVSAISSVNGYFSQNVKSLDDYYQLLSRKELPILRGYQLNTDDIIRKNIIQQLACHFHLDIKSIEQKFNITFADYFAHELKIIDNLQKDGLLIKESDSINVTDLGRILVRHVCMVFDVYLPSHMNDRFSKVI